MNQKTTVPKKQQLSQNDVKILGVKITSSQSSYLLRKITLDIKSKRKFYIVTPNPEIVMAAQSDDDLMQALGKSEIALPDGIGIIAAHKFLSLPTPDDFFLRFFTLLFQGLGVGFSILFDRKWLTEDLKVIRGREFFLELIKLANKNSWKVYLLGGEHGEAGGTKRILESNYKKIKIQARQGPMLFNDGTPKTDKDKKEQERVIEEINTFSPQLLFVCFDHRKQEKWVYRNISKLNVGGAMVLGGTFKYITGMQKLPPKFLADSGLEWLWRYITRSQKTKRIVKAFPQFPLKVFAYKLNG